MSDTSLLGRLNRPMPWVSQKQVDISSQVLRTAKCVAFVMCNHGSGERCACTDVAYKLQLSHD